MSGPFISEHGDVISSALSFADNLINKADEMLYQEMRLVRGQILAVYSVDAPLNSEGSPGVYTLYDVQIWSPSGETEVLRRCLALQPAFGGTYNNFMEVIPPDPGPDAKDPEIAASEKPGTHVLVGFIHGQRNFGVILGALPHPNKLAANLRPKKDLGTHLEGAFQGINWKITNEGSLLITFTGPSDNEGALVDDSLGPTEIEINDQGSVRIETNEGQIIQVDREEKVILIENGEECTMKMEQDGNKITVECTEIEVNTTDKIAINAEGDITVAAKGDVNLTSGGVINLAHPDGSGDEPFVLGNKLVQFLSDLCNACAQIQVVGNLGAPTTPPINAAQFASLSSQAQTLISELIMGTK